MDNLADKVASFDGDATRVCCFAHVMNLVVKSVLAQFDVPTTELEVMAPGAAGSNATSADGNNSDARAVTGQSRLGWDRHSKCPAGLPQPIRRAPRYREEL